MHEHHLTPCEGADEHLSEEEKNRLEKIRHKIADACIEAFAKIFDKHIERVDDPIACMIFISTPEGSSIVFSPNAAGCAKHDKSDERVHIAEHAVEHAQAVVEKEQAAAKQEPRRAH